MRKRGLKRGLDSLLGEPVKNPDLQNTESKIELKEPIHIDIDLIRSNPFQPRKNFDDNKLKELSLSISKDGVIQPILVRRDPEYPDNFQIVAGERRWRAAQLAGLHKVPVIFKDYNDNSMAELALIENIQRENLNPIEEAFGYQRLIDSFGLTQEIISGKVGKSRSYIANTLRLLNLSDRIIALVEEGKLSSGHARALINMDNAEEITKIILNKGLNVRQTELLVKEYHKNKITSESKIKDPNIKSLETKLSQSTGLVVKIQDNNGKGSVYLKYSNLDQLDSLISKISK